MFDLGRLYCTSVRGHYVDAFIFPSQKAMYDYIREEGHDPDGCAAMCLGFTKFNEQGNQTKHIGTLCFYRSKLGSGIVSHECTHAALNWLRLKYPRCLLGDDLSDTPVVSPDHPEEYLCWVVGNLVAQFWSRYYEWGANEELEMKGGT